MIRDDIESILKGAGWRRTTGYVEPGLIDYQSTTSTNRLLLYPDDFIFVTKEVLEELMKETNVPLHGDILHKAEKVYMEKQMRLTSNEDELKRREHEMREKLVKVINEVPLEYLPDLICKISEFLKGKKVTESAQEKWTGVAEKRGGEVVTEEEVKVAVLGMATTEDAVEGERMFTAIQAGLHDYRSAVVIDGNVVRAVECLLGKAHGGVVRVKAANYEYAAGIRILFDGWLNREIIIVRVTRNELMLSVSYISKGIKKKPKTKPKGLHYRQDDGLTLVDEEGNPVFEQGEERMKRKGEGGESPFLIKKAGE